MKLTDSQLAMMAAENEIRKIVNEDPNNSKTILKRSLVDQLQVNNYRPAGRFRTPVVPEKLDAIIYFLENRLCLKTDTNATNAISVLWQYINPLLVMSKDHPSIIYTDPNQRDIFYLIWFRPNGYVYVMKVFFQDLPNIIQELIIEISNKGFNDETINFG